MEPSAHVSEETQHLCVTGQKFSLCGGQHKGAESPFFSLQVGVQWRRESGRRQEKFPEVMMIGGSLETPPTDRSREAVPLLTFCSFQVQHVVVTPKSASLKKKVQQFL